MMSDLIFVMDKDERFTFYHTPKDGKLYTPPETFTGKEVSEVMPPHFIEPFREAIEKNRKGEVSELEYWLEIGGEKIWFSALLSPLFSGKEYTGSISIVKDITKQVTTEKDLDKTKRRYKELFENTIIGIYRSTPDGSILLANPALLRMMGYSSFDELSRRNLEKEGFEANYPRSHFKELIEGKGEMVAHEAAWERKDGSILHVRENARVIRDGSGNSIFYEGTVEDITEWKNVEMNLKESEEKFRILSEKSPNMIYIGDGTKIIYVNNKVEEILGYSKEEIYGDEFDFKSTLDKSSIEVAEDMFTRCLNGEEVPPYKLVFINKIGREIPILNSLAPIEYAKKRVIVGIGVEVTDVMEMQQALQEREKNFQTLVDNANDGILIGNRKGNHVYANNMAAKITGFSVEELQNMHMKELAHPDEKKKLLARYNKRMKGEKVPSKYETYILRKNGDKLPVEITAAISLWHGEKADLVIMRDISERKRTEDEMRKQLIKFRLEVGNLYLVKEVTPTFSIEVFDDLLNVGFRGLVASRQTEKEFRSTLDREFDFLWFAEKKGEKILPPKLDKIEKTIDNTPFNTAILLDRMDYLITKNGFSKTLSFVQSLREIAYLSDQIIILSLDPSVMEEREMRLMEKETREIIPLQKAWLPDELFSVLKFVFSQNQMGIKPSYTKVSKAMGISKPTTGKRMRRLVESGYLIESSKGKSKVVELSADGKRLFME